MERVWDWVRKSRGRISEQHRRLGVSCDWSRETFTLDPGPSRAVRHTFVDLYRKGLIYRGERIINWCPRCATALSDLEVEHRETEGHLYYIHYPLVNGNGRLTVATTRPETLLGDTAVAVNPNDPRYAKFVGKEVVLPILRRRIPVVGDEAVETEFGTGALKVTPGHDPTDFDLGERHGLPIVTVMHPNGAMNAEAGPYAGLDRFEARIQIVEDLQKAGLLERVEEHRHAVGHCQRCTQVVEPMVSKQWFVSIAPLAKPALDVVRDGTVRIVPERFTRIYENWMENLRDWCISRQLWWGHRIPVWYCNACEHEIVEYEDPAACPGCGSIDLRQDEDMLDTWFSSGLWPHSTLGWPDETADMDYFYPTSVMETAHDILFFWVARMIMLGMENTGKAPFHTVFLSGLIRDVEGAKMSKTRGNVLDPIEAIDQYGCDALRFALTVGNAPGNDARLGNAKLEAARNFANKIWNATRYVVRAMEEAEDLRGWSDPMPVHLEDRWIKSSLNKLVARVTRQLEEYQLGEAEQSIYEFLWSEFCDWYIEAAKVRIRNNDGPSPVPMLVHVLETTLRLLHPFMPFVTEEAWSNLVSRAPSERELADSIMVSHTRWPTLARSTTRRRMQSPQCARPFGWCATPAPSSAFPRRSLWSCWWTRARQACTWRPKRPSFARWPAWSRCASSRVGSSCPREARRRRWSAARSWQSRWRVSSTSRRSGRGCPASSPTRSRRWSGWAPGWPTRSSSRRPPKRLSNGSVSASGPRRSGKRDCRNSLRS